jgi:hypothetical protein
MSIPNEHVTIFGLVTSSLDLSVHTFLFK